MRKAKIGILERTASELAELSPQQRHDSLAHLIPMQSPESFRWVRLKHVPKKLELGWLFKRQNRLQEMKVNLALVIHQAYRSGHFRTATVAKMMEQVAHATVGSFAQVKREIEAKLGGENVQLEQVG